MIRQARQLPGPVPDRQGVREYGLLFALLFAWTNLWILVTVFVEAFSVLVLATLDSRLVGSIVYATLGTATLAAIAALARRFRTTGGGLEAHERVQLGGTVWLVLLVVTYVLHGATNLPVFPRDFLTVLLVGPVSMGFLALAYARARGTDVRIAIPDRTVRHHIFGTALAALVVGMGWIAVLLVTDNALFRLPFGGSFTPRLSVGELVWRAVVPALASGFGWGLLFNGAIQEGLRGYLDPVSAVAGVTALIGVLSWTTGTLLRTTDPVATAGTTAGVVFLSLLAAHLAALCTRTLSRRLDTAPALLVGASVGVLVGAVPLLGASVILTGSLGLVPIGLSWTVVAAIAAVGYERSRSVWVPIAAFATFFVVADANLARFLVGTLF